MRHLRSREPKHEKPTGGEAGHKPGRHKEKSSSTLIEASAGEAANTTSSCSAENIGQKLGKCPVPSAGLPVRAPRKSRGKSFSEQPRNRTRELRPRKMDDSTSGDESQLGGRNSPAKESALQDEGNNISKVLRVSIPYAEREIADHALNQLQRAAMYDDSDEDDPSLPEGEGLCCCCIRLSCSCTEHLPSCVWSPNETEILKPEEKGNEENVLENTSADVSENSTTNDAVEGEKDCSVALNAATCSNDQEVKSTSSTHHCQEIRPILINSSNLPVSIGKTDESISPKEADPASSEGQNNCAQIKDKDCHIHSKLSQEGNSESVSSEAPEGSAKEENLSQEIASSTNSTLTNTVKLSDTLKNLTVSEENTLDKNIPNSISGRSPIKQGWAALLKIMATKQLLQKLKSSQDCIDTETKPAPGNNLLDSDAGRNSPFIEMPSLLALDTGNSDTQDSWVSREMPNLGSPMVNLDSEATSRSTGPSVTPCSTPTPNQQLKEEPAGVDLSLVKAEPPETDASPSQEEPVEIDSSLVKDEPWKCCECGKVITGTVPWLKQDCEACDETNRATPTEPIEESAALSQSSNNLTPPAKDNALTDTVPEHTESSGQLLQSPKKESPVRCRPWPPLHLAQPVPEETAQFEVNPTASMPTVGMITEVQACKPLRSPEAHNMRSVLDGADEIVGLTNEMVRFCVSVAHKKGQPPPGKTFVFPVQSPDLVKKMEQKWQSGNKVKVTKLSTLTLTAEFKIEKTSPEKCAESPLPVSAEKELCDVADLNCDNSEGENSTTEELTETIKTLNCSVSDIGSDMSAMDIEAPIENTEATAVDNCGGEVASILSLMIDFVSLKCEPPEISYDPDDDSRKQVPESNIPSKSKTVGGRKSLELECRRLNVNLFYMPQKSNGCTSESCTLGCVCDSLQGHVVQEHCGKPECVLVCSCEAQENAAAEDNKPGNLSRGTMLWIEGEAKKNLAKEESRFQQTVVRSEDDQLFHLGRRQRRVSRLPSRFSKDFFLNASEAFARGLPKNSDKISPGKSQAATKKGSKSNHTEHNPAGIEVSPPNSNQKGQAPVATPVSASQCSKVTACLEAYNRNSSSHEDKSESDSLVIASVQTLDPTDWEATDSAQVVTNQKETSPPLKKKSVNLSKVVSEFNFIPPEDSNEVLLPCWVLKRMFERGKAFVWMRRKSTRKAEVFVSAKNIQPKACCVEIRDLDRMLYPEFPHNLDVLLSKNTNVRGDGKFPLWVLIYELDQWVLTRLLERADCDVCDDLEFERVKSPTPSSSVAFPRKEPRPAVDTELCLVLPAGQNPGASKYESGQELPLRWLLLSLKTPSPYDGVYFYLHQKAVGFKQLCTIALLANQTGKYYRLNLPSSDMSSMAQLHPDFAVFGLPGFKSYIVMGPYKGQQKLGFSLFKREPPYRRIGVPLYCGGPLGYGEVDGFSNVVSEPIRSLPADGAKSHWLYVASQSERDAAEMELLEVGFDLVESTGRKARKMMNYLKRHEPTKDTGATLFGRMKQRSSDVSVRENGELAQPLTSGQSNKLKPRIRQLDQNARKTICVPELVGDKNRVIEDLEYELDVTESDTIDPTSSQDEDDVALSVRMQYIMPSRKKSLIKKRKRSNPQGKAQQAIADVNLATKKQVYLVSVVKNLGYLIIDELVNGFLKIQNPPPRFPMVHSDIKNLCRTFNRFVLENIQTLKTVAVSIRWALVNSKIECGTQNPFSSKVFEPNYLLLPGIVLNLHNLDVKGALELRLPRDAHKELLQKLDDDDCNYELRYEANRLGVILNCSDKSKPGIKKIAEIAKKEVNRLQTDQVRIQEEKLYLQFRMKELLTTLSAKLKGTPPHYLEWAKNEALRIISTKSKKPPVEVDESAFPACLEDDIEEVEVSSESDGEGGASHADEMEDESIQNEGLAANDDTAQQNDDLDQAEISHKNTWDQGGEETQSLAVKEGGLQQNHKSGKAEVSHINVNEREVVGSQDVADNEDQPLLNQYVGQVELPHQNVKKIRPKKKKENPVPSKEVTPSEGKREKKSKGGSGSASRPGLSLSMSPFTRVNLVVEEDRIIQASSKLCPPLNALEASGIRKRRQEDACHIPTKVQRLDPTTSVGLDPEFTLASHERSFSPSDFLHSVDDVGAAQSTAKDPTGRLISQVKQSDKEIGTQLSAQKYSSPEQINSAFSSDINKLHITSVTLNSSETNSNLVPFTAGTRETVLRVTSGSMAPSHPAGRPVSVIQEANCPPLFSTNMKTFSANTITVQHPMQSSGGRIVYCSSQPIVHSSAGIRKVTPSTSPGSQIFQSPVVQAQGRQTSIPGVMSPVVASTASYQSPPSTSVPFTAVLGSPVQNPAFLAHQKQVTGCNTTLPPLPTLIPRPKVSVIQRAPPFLTATNTLATVSSNSTNQNMATVLSSAVPTPTTSGIKLIATSSPGGQMFPRMLGKAVVLRFAPVSTTGPGPGVQFMARQVRHVPPILRTSTSTSRRMETESMTVPSNNEVPSPSAFSQCAEGMLSQGMTSTPDNVTKANDC